MVVWIVSVGPLKSRHQDRIRYVSTSLGKMPVKECGEGTREVRRFIREEGRREAWAGGV